MTPMRIRVALSTVTMCACGTPSGGVGGAPDASSQDAPSLDAGSCANLPPLAPVDHAAPDLTILGEPGVAPDAGAFLGIYDPSLLYSAGAEGGVLSYSITSTDGVHTRIAVSSDHGATFTFVADANHVDSAKVTTNDTGVCGGSTCAVTMWHEVSSIVADPTDPIPARSFKLFVHTYARYAPTETLRRDWGYIGLYTAPAPNGPWSAETPLLGWKSNGALPTAPSQLLTDVPELSDCIVFTEPGAIVTEQGIDLALSCLSLPGGVLSYRVVLLRSNDHGQTFSYAGPLLLPKDAACLGSTVSAVNGADLFIAGGKEYLMVTPIAPIAPNPISPSAVDYAGCMVIPVSDPVSGALERTDTGAPRVVRWLAADDGRFTGPCTFAEGATSAGYIVPMVSQLPAPIFHVHATSIAGP